MADVVQVEPRPESYVHEWRAIRVDGDATAIARLLRQVGAVLYADFSGIPGSVVMALRTGVNLRAGIGDWIVFSPHDKVSVFDHETFNEQFEVVT